MAIFGVDLGTTFCSLAYLHAQRPTLVALEGAEATLASVVRFDDGRVVAMLEYNDSHHAAVIFKEPGQWPDLKPPTNPRRRSRPVGSPIRREEQ